MIKKVLQYIFYDIWFKKEYEYRSSKVRWFVRQLKVLLFTAQGIGEHSILLRSAALTFYTLMSIVPMAALVFGIAKGFGLDARFNTYLYTEFPQYSIVIDQVIDFADNLLERTKGGILASVGLLTLFWTIIKVFGNVEDSFNKIWEVRKSRSLTRKFSDYLSVVIVTPILWVLSGTISFQLQNHLLHITSGWFVEFLFGLISLVILWLMFTFLYRVMPNTKVKFRSAFLAGIIAGTFFQLFQIIYVNIQSGLSNYNAIYGSFAALPLLMIWLQISWQIVLFGAELSFAYQNIDKFEYEKQAEEMSYDYRKKAMLVVMQQIVRHFVHNEGAVSSEMIAHDVNLPLRIVRDVIDDLLKAGLVVATATQDEKINYYVPARDVHTLKIHEVIHKVETWGRDPLEIEQCPEYHTIDRILQQMGDSIEHSAYNIRLMDIQKEEASISVPTSTSSESGKEEKA